MRAIKKLPFRKPSTKARVQQTTTLASTLSSPSQPISSQALQAANFKVEWECQWASPA